MEDAERLVEVFLLESWAEPPPPARTGDGRGPGGAETVPGAACRGPPAAGDAPGRGQPQQDRVIEVEVTTPVERNGFVDANSLLLKSFREMRFPHRHRTSQKNVNFKCQSFSC